MRPIRQRSSGDSLGEVDYENQVRDHAADESGRPDNLCQECLISVNVIGAVGWLGAHLASSLRSVEGRDDVPSDESQDRKDGDYDRGVLDRRVSGEPGRLGFWTVRVIVGHRSSLIALCGQQGPTRPVRTRKPPTVRIGQKA